MGQFSHIHFKSFKSIYKSKSICQKIFPKININFHITQNLLVESNFIHSIENTLQILKLKIFTELEKTSSYLESRKASKLAQIFHPKSSSYSVELIYPRTLYILLGNQFVH